MVGIVILSHGALAQALEQSARMFVGEREQISCIGINPGDNPDEFADRVYTAIKSVDTGDGVIALTDLLGGTPFNTVSKIARENSVQVLTGVNLSMVIHSIIERTPNMPAAKIATGALKIGQEDIILFNE